MSHVDHPSSTPEPQYVSARAFARHLTERGLPVSHEAVRQWVKRGRLPSIQLPSDRLCIPLSVADAILAGVRHE